MSFHEPMRVKQLLGPLGRKIGIADSAASSRLWQEWVEIVGPDVAAHAEPTSLRDGVLRVRTESSVWATEIGYLTGEIARRANEVAGAGTVREVRVWTSPAPITRRKNTEPPRADATPGHPRAVTTDPGAAFRRAWEAWARRRSKGSD